MHNTSHADRAAAERVTVGREDVTAIIEDALNALPHPLRLYRLMNPEFYAHRITEALIREGVIKGEGDG